jgi:hypothetical protein
VRKKTGYLKTQFQRLRQRRGPKKAICAVAASILTAIYHMLRDGTCYRDPGPDHFSTLSPQTKAEQLVRKIKQLGFTCQIAPATDAEAVSV